MTPETLEEALDLAIAEEQKAAEGYRRLSVSAETAEVRNLFARFAREEEAHRDSLERVRLGDLEIFAKPWPDKSEMVFAPNQGDVPQNASPQTVILAAMDDERRAMLLYTELAKYSDDPGIKTLLDAIAREEAHHWASLEKLYDSMCSLSG